MQMKLVVAARFAMNAKHLSSCFEDADETTGVVRKWRNTREDEGEKPPFPSVANERSERCEWNVVGGRAVRRDE